MKRLERLELVSRIGRELQSRMTYSDIDAFLKSMDLKIRTDISGSNSKWVYVKDQLAEVSDEIVLRLAEELDIPHGHTLARGQIREDSRFWLPGHFRLFISHLAIQKVKAAQLKEVLKKYAISCFVAHEDIEPTMEWQDEIEKGLLSMDSLLAILSPGFHESKWTDQEIGFALGRGTLVIPLRKGIDPYGFIGKIQGIQAEGKTIGQVAELVFQAIAGNVSTRTKIANVLVDQVIAASSVEAALQLLVHLRSIPLLAASHLERLRDNLTSNAELAEDSKFVRALNAALSEKQLGKFVYVKAAEVFDDDNIPF